MNAITCRQVRDALSADLDGEAVGLDAEAVHHHLGTCATCQRFATALPDVARRTRLAAATPVPVLTGPIVAAAATPPGRRSRRVRDLRVLVALAGVAQLVLALPLLVGVIGPDLHLGRDLGALQVALGVGLLFAAYQPRRAAGVLPIAAVVAAVTVIAATVDVATGAVSLTAELTHLSEIVGVLALWRLTRHLSRPSHGPAAPASPRRPGSVAPSVADVRAGLA